ncbi:hypothetical protein SFR_0913 [Streptomyces sp. FR-008]|nr:hypothetical protein SFR_0913 [Streptomyces sp. FR-008]
MGGPRRIQQTRPGHPLRVRTASRVPSATGIGGNPS